MYFDNRKIKLKPEEIQELFDCLGQFSKNSISQINKYTPADLFNQFLKTVNSRLKNIITHNPELINYLFLQLSEYLKNPKCLTETARR